MSTLEEIRYRLRTWDTSPAALRDFVDHAVEDLETLVEIAEEAERGPRVTDEAIEASDRWSLEEIAEAIDLLDSAEGAELSRLVAIGRRFAHFSEEQLGRLVLATHPEEA